MKTTIELLRRLWKAGAFSPEAFAARALLSGGAVCSFVPGRLAGIHHLFKRHVRQHQRGLENGLGAGLDSSPALLRLHTVDADLSDRRQSAGGMESMAAGEKTSESIKNCYTQRSHLAPIVNSLSSSEGEKSLNQLQLLEGLYHQLGDGLWSQIKGGQDLRAGADGER